MKKQRDIKIKKTTFYMIVSAVLLLAISAVIVIYYFTPKQSINTNIIEKTPEEINAYKKALYQGTLCHYSCPLTEIEFEGNPLLFPEPSCTQECNKNLQQFKNQQGSFTEIQLLEDTLFSEIELIITNCRNINKIQENLNIENTQSFFDCASGDLERLKEKYNYIN